MKIGIDARLINETGVGRYIRNLIHSLAVLDNTNSYVVFLSESAYQTFELPNNRWQKRLANIHWHTLREQIELPFIFLREHLDLLHVPYFTVPLLYPGKVIATIHDITILQVRTGKATTLPYPLYFLKWLSYAVLLRLGTWKCTAILTVSNTVKEELKRYLKINDNKIHITYEGIDPTFQQLDTTPPQLNFPYFLYVGNVYPHKQAEFLLQAYAEFIDSQKIDISFPKLVFVGKRDFFYERLERESKKLQLSEHVVFMHDVEDSKLKNLYRYAAGLLFPSTSEGFGLPALEALSQQTIVLASDIPVFRELLDGCAVFLPHDIHSWSSALNAVIHNQYAKIQTQKIGDVIKNYNWDEMAKKTKRMYEHCISI